MESATRVEVAVFPQLAVVTSSAAVAVVAVAAAAVVPASAATVHPARQLAVVVKRIVEEGTDSYLLRQSLYLQVSFPLHRQHPHRTTTVKTLVPKSAQV